MKFAERYITTTSVSTQQTVYLKDDLMRILEVKAGDSLEWYYLQDSEGAVHKCVRKKQ